MRITFEKVERKRKIRVDCLRCGKMLTRTVSEWSTISPFNRNDDGTVKSRAEVAEQVTQKLEERIGTLTREGVICRSCSAPDKEPR